MGRREPALLLVGILALVLLACPGPPGDTGNDVGEDGSNQAPDFTLPSLGGGSVSLEDLRGKTVLVDFWATWCAPCVHQIPVLNEFHAAHAEDGVAVYGIAVDSEGAEAVAPFAEEHGIAYPVLLGTESVARSFGAIGFPTLYVIAPDGSIDSVHIGVADLEDLEQAVAAARNRVGES